LSRGNIVHGGKVRHIADLFYAPSPPGALAWTQISPKRFFYGCIYQTELEV